MVPNLSADQSVTGANEAGSVVSPTLGRHRRTEQRIAALVQSMQPASQVDFLVQGPEAGGRTLWGSGGERA